MVDNIAGHKADIGYINKKKERKTPASVEKMCLFDIVESKKKYPESME